MGRRHHRERSFYRSLKKLLKKEEVQGLLINSLGQLLTAGASIIAYYFMGGLFASVIAALIALPLSLAMIKLSGYKIEPLQYVALFFLAVLGLPAILLDNPFLAKIQEPISGLLMGIGFGGISLWQKDSVIKKVVPDIIKNIPFLNKHLFSKSEGAWKKIDYLWAAEMTLSAALSMGAVFLFSTDMWFIAKYTIGPVLTLFSFGITGGILYTDHPEPLLENPRYEQRSNEYEPPHHNPQRNSNAPRLTVVYDSVIVPDAQVTEHDSNKVNYSYLAW